MQTCKVCCIGKQVTNCSSISFISFAKVFKKNLVLYFTRRCYEIPSFIDRFLVYLSQNHFLFIFLGGLYRTDKFIYGFIKKGILFSIRSNNLVYIISKHGFQNYSKSSFFLVGTNLLKLQVFYYNFY